MDPSAFPTLTLLSLGCVLAVALLSLAGDLGWSLRQHGSDPAGCPGQYYPPGADRGHPQGQGPGARG